jgi:hypothetical protein
MVAEHDVNAATRGGGLVLQTHEEIEHAARVGASVYHISETHEMGCAARPVRFCVDESRRRKDFDERGVRAMNVGNGDDPCYVGEARLCGRVAAWRTVVLAVRECRQHEQQRCRARAHAQPPPSRQSSIISRCSSFGSLMVS